MTVLITGGAGAPVAFDQARPYDVARCVFSVARAGRELGWQPAVPLAQGLKTTLAWYTGT